MLDPYIVEVEGALIRLLARCPSMMRVASSMKLIFSTLLTKGKLREARRLHSMTLISLPLARNWILNGPEMCSASASGG